MSYIVGPIFTNIGENPVGRFCGTLLVKFLVPPIVCQIAQKDDHFEMQIPKSF